MQVKIIIGTVAFMLTMILLGFYTLLEETRLENFTSAREGRQIEAGAALFYNNCASCHGDDGKAEVCYDHTTGEELEEGCLGLPLNSYGLVCGAPSQRMESRGWTGSKEQFVNLTISGGRNGGVMVAWGQDFGGPLQANEVTNLTKYVLNFENDELCAVEPPVFPWPANVEELPDVTSEDAEATYTTEQLQAFGAPANLPVTFPGDAERGAELYAGTYACTSCHGVPEESAASAGVGPWHGDDWASIAATRVDGQSAEQYTYESILYPNNYIVPECPNGPCSEPSQMPGGYPADFSSNPQDLADIVTYLLIER